jgi:hypothetical protein
MIYRGNSAPTRPRQSWTRTRFRRLPIPKLLELLDEYETELAAADGVLPHPVSTLRADLARLIN